MKKKMRKILFDSWHASGAKTWIYLLVVLGAGTLLSLTLFFTNGNSIENSLASSVSLSLSYKNNSYVSAHYDESMGQMKASVLNDAPEVNQQVYQMFLQNLDDLSANAEVKYFNYNFYNWFTTDQGDLQEVFGINDVRFYDEENITIIEGTGDINAGEVVVSDQQQYTEEQADGSFVQRDAAIGDTYTFINTCRNDGSTIFSLKVAGIYHDAGTMTASDEDDFINSHGMITLNTAFTQLLSDHPEYYGGTTTETVYTGVSIQNGRSESINKPVYYDSQGNFLWDRASQDYQEIESYEQTTTYSPPTINHIVLKTDTLDDYVSLKQKFDKMSIETNRQAAKIFGQVSSAGQLKFTLQTNENYFGSILDSIARIKKIYMFIFLGVYILLVLTLYSFISYMQQARSREIFIQYSLGRSPKKTGRYYMKYYAVLGFAVSLIACIPGYLLSWILSSSTAAAGAQRQNEFLHAQGQASAHYAGISLFDLSAQRVLFSIVFTVLMMELVILICAWISTRRVLKGSLTNHARGGR